MPAKGIAHFGLLLSLSLCINPVHAVTVSDLLISEVMANPAALSDARGEWFELYNPITEVINLHEVTIGDDGSDRHKIESDPSQPQVVVTVKGVGYAWGTSPEL